MVSDIVRPICMNLGPLDLDANFFFVFLFFQVPELEVMNGGHRRL